MSNGDFNLLWVSKCNYPAKHVVNTNFHEYYQIVFILSGEGKIFVEGVEHEVKVNDLYIFKPNVKHAIHASLTKNLNTAEVKFFSNNITNTARLNQLEYLVKENNGRIRNTFISIIDEVKESDIYTETVINHLLNQLIIFLTRQKYRDAEDRLNSLSPPLKICTETIQTGKQGDTLDSIVEYINKEYSKEIKLNDLAEMIYLSPVYFCSVFKERYGVSPIQYLQKVRLENAKNMLSNSDESVTKIAEKVGFQSVHYFSRFFKNKEGVTPNKYRRRLQGFIYKDFNGNVTRLY